MKEIIASNTMWSKKTPTIGGWYEHRKDGITSRYFLRAFGQLNPLMPSHLLLAYKGDGKVGENIICETNKEFFDCEWNGPLSEEPSKIWAL